MRIAALLACLSLTLGGPTPSSSARAKTGAAGAANATGLAVESTGAGGSPGPCADGKYNFLGPHAGWQTPLRWSFRRSSVPSGLDAAEVLAIIEQSFQNVVEARNDCGLPDRVSAAETYIGETSRKPGVTANGSCTGSDGYNVVGFGRLGGYYSGYTCIYWMGERIVEADMRLDTDTAWALSAADCSNQLMMEALVTHEAGHAFGLDHVSEARHGRLTMSLYIDGLCQNQEATLGLGDVRGLEALY